MSKFKIIDLNGKNMTVDSAIEYFEDYFSYTSVYDPKGAYDKNSDHYVLAVLKKLKDKGHIRSYNILFEMRVIPYDEVEIIGIDDLDEDEDLLWK